LDELLINVGLDLVQVLADVVAWMASAPFLRFLLHNVLKLNCPILLMQAMDDLPLVAQHTLVSQTFCGTDPFPVSQCDLHALYQSGNAHFSAADGSTVWVSIRQYSITVLLVFNMAASISLYLQLSMMIRLEIYRRAQ